MYSSQNVHYSQLDYQNLKFNGSGSGDAGPFFIGAAALSNSLDGGSLTVGAQSASSTQPRDGGPLLLKSGSKGNGSTDVDGYVAIYHGATEAMRVDPDGNVGIGMTTPGAALDVVGSIAATGTVKTTPTTVGALPAAATAGAGARTFVTDSANSLSSHHGQTVSGGGANFSPVYSDGTNWLAG
jgi:streptogramin lyase